MSILIKGMKMPKCCDVCQFSGWSNLHQTALCKVYDYEPCFEDYSQEYTSKRSNNCPLVELPEKHGRLIDADAFAEFIEDAIKSQRYKYVTVDGTMTVADVLTAVIDDLKGNTIVKYESNPTVIESEGEE